MNDLPSILYHGSYCAVEKPDLDRCAQHKDFGQGFYLTSSLQQAKSFAHISLRKARVNGLATDGNDSGWVSAFRMANEDWRGLALHRFRTANREWLACVVAHRMQHGSQALINKYAPYDVVAGKIANDTTNVTITTYLTGVFGPVGSARAANACIALLLPERLKDQFCFRTQRAIERLEFLWAKPL